jgi:hypothetical protein
MSVTVGSMPLQSTGFVVGHVSPGLATLTFTASVPADFTKRVGTVRWGRRRGPGWTPQPDATAMRTQWPAGLNAQAYRQGTVPTNSNLE